MVAAVVVFQSTPTQTTLIWKVTTPSEPIRVGGEESYRMANTASLMFKLATFPGPGKPARPLCTTPPRAFLFYLCLTAPLKL